jgi:peroxiredoxin/tetratricopeptide (TPR) repeat protein
MVLVPFLITAVPAQEASQAAAGAAEEGTVSSAASIPLAGHSAHGAAYNEGPRQNAYLMGGTGDVSFPVSTDNDQAQAFFNQGIGQLHGFWYYEAERSFRRVAALDPSCAMAYWGMAAANHDNAERARQFLADALQRKDQASRRELLYIDALDRLLQDDERSDAERRRRYVRDLEQIIREFPEDVEAKAFLAVHLWQSDGRGVPINSHQAVNSLLEEVFRVHPMHPAHHYRIHLWDREHPEQALASAARCGQSSPDIAHMWHMPGHIYSRLKRYEDAVFQQEASARVDHAHMMRDRVMPDQIGNYAHNNEWLIRNLIFLGHVDEALDLARNMLELPRHPQYNSFAKKGSCSCKYGRERLMQVLETFELWDQVVGLSETMYLEPTDQPREQARLWRLLGLAHYHRGESPRLQQCVARLEQLLEVVDADAACSEGEGDGDAKKKRAPFASALWELRGLQYLARGETEEAISLLRKAEAAPRPRQALYEFLCGKHDEARRIAQQAGEPGKNEVPPLAVRVDLLQRMEAWSEAREAFESLRKVAGTADLDTPLLKRLAPLAARFEWPADWRLRPPHRDDIGERPGLATLGPFRWAPSPAPEWSLTDVDGNAISLSDFRGRPVVAIFYLGFGCLHCVEQLQAFAPRVGDFKTAGISLVGIGTDDSESLARAVRDFSPESRFPIPLVANPELDVFQAYRCFDDFEQMSLHGTFLIDSDGRIRWQDISYEPFEDVDFLLTEAQRLLSIPAAP